MHWSHFAQVAANSLVTDIWQGFVLAAGVGLCLQWLPRTTARMRFAVWAVVFSLIGILPLLHLFAKAMNHGTTSHGVANAVVHADARWSLGIAAAWALLSLVRSAQFLHGAMQLRSIHRSAVPLINASDLRIGFRRVALCTSAEVDRPSVIGFFSPRILIPDWLIEKLSIEELDQVVLHEMGHLRRGDDWLNLLQKIGLVLFPLNPALLWVERRLCLERELACDDDVLSRTAAPKSYATCLTRLAEHRLERRSLALTLGAWSRRSELAQRVYSILKRGEGMGRMQARLVMSALLLALLGGAAGLSRCRQLVAFTAPQPDASANWTADPATESDMKAAMQPVVFHPGHSAAHETLLKATIPATKSVRAVAKKKIHPPQPQMLKARIAPPRMQRQWIVLTAWESDAPALAVTAHSERAEFTTYAVPTPSGWLVIQL